MIAWNSVAKWAADPGMSGMLIKAWRIQQQMRESATREPYIELDDGKKFTGKKKKNMINTKISMVKIHGELDLYLSDLYGKNHG